MNKITNEKAIKQFIENELCKFDFRRGTKGYKYLKEAICLCIINENAIDNLTRNVFPIIAKRHDEKSYLSIKWCIEQCITTMYNNTPIDIISKYFMLPENLKPSLKLIINIIVCSKENKNVK